MKYDLVLSDFDGTLLRRDDTISPRTVAAIGKYVAAGGVFGVSTGRSYASICKRLDELGLKGSYPVMSCQGSLFRDSESGETLARIPMEKAAAVEFLRRAERLGLVCQFYTDEEIYAPEGDDRNAEYFRINRLTPVRVPCVSEFADRCDMPILKTLTVIDPPERERILKAMGSIADATVFASHAMLIEAVSDKAGKGNGLKLACRNLGIDVRRSVAIGDELNDIDMLKSAGLGVAMGNAVPETKRAADYIADDCDGDGVAKVLEDILADRL